MKGILFTITIFLIFIGVVTYAVTVASITIEKSNLITEKVSAQRIYYTWKGIADDVIHLLNLTVSRNNSMVEFNDTLPANPQTKIEDMLSWYQMFLEEYVEDGTIEVRFENADGEKVDLKNDTDSVVVIKPMNIKYRWDNYGKNQLFIEVDPSNFSYINNIDLYIKLKNVYFNCDPEEQGSCNKWAPYKPCTNSTTYCLKFNLTFEDMYNDVYNFPEKLFDVDKMSVANLDVKNVTAPFFIKIQVGSLPTVINIDLKSVMVDTSTKINLTTTDFYINMLAKLNVSTPFGKKVDWIG